MRRSSQIASLVLTLTAAGVAAQIPPAPPYDAGALMRQTEQMMRQNQMQQAARKREPLPPAATISQDTVVQAERFKFSGNKLLSTEQLQLVTEPYTKRALNQHELQHLTDAISEAYRHTGWLVQAYIPRQDLTAGEITLQVIETIPPSKPAR